jgi:hypothetical protein
MIVNGVIQGSCTNAALPANGVFTGTWENMAGWNNISVSHFSDQSGLLSVQWSFDGSNPFQGDVTQYMGGNVFLVPKSVLNLLFRIVYTNGAVAQNTFVLGCVAKFADNLFQSTAYNLELTQRESQGKYQEILDEIKEWKQWWAEDKGLIK